MARAFSKATGNPSPKSQSKPFKPSAFKTANKAAGVSARATGATPATKRPPSKPWQRILIKLSGEMLRGDGSYGIQGSTVANLAKHLSKLSKQGIEIALVIGGGNIFRGKGAELEGLNRATADYMGMLATLINGLALQSCLEVEGTSARVMSALPMDAVCEPYIRRRAISHLEKGRVVIFAGGTGNPFFTTDSAAALRASETNCEVLLKATKVSGVYSKDPKKHKDAVRYSHLSYDEMLLRHLQVMDATAITLAAENNLPIVVFSVTDPAQLARVVNGKGEYTLIAK